MTKTIDDAVMTDEETINITAYFDDLPGSDTDQLCESIFEQYGGESIGSGTWIASDPPERDIEYSVASDKADACIAALKQAGFRLEPLRQLKFATNINDAPKIIATPGGFGDRGLTDAAEFARDDRDKRIAAAEVIMRDCFHRYNNEAEAGFTSEQEDIVAHVIAHEMMRQFEHDIEAR